MPHCVVPAPAPLPTLISDRPALSLVDELQAAFAAYDQEPGAEAVRERIAIATRTLARQVLALSKRDVDDAVVRRALQVVRQLGASGIHDYALAPADRALITAAPQTWPAVVAMMLLGSAWQWGTVPTLESMPAWLWGDYTTWIFAAPHGFTAAGDADRYAAFLLPRLEELARLVERNAGAATVRAAGNAYLSAASGIPLYFAHESLRRHAELRGRILKRLLAREPVPYQPVAFSRYGRRLRVGVLNRHFGPQTETYTTLPTFEQLDPQRFEVVLFSLRPADTPLAAYCRSHAHEFHVLPAGLEQQLATLRAANLDVLVFGTNVTAAVHEVTRLALFRIAPLQVVNNSSCITSGLPEIDLYVSGDLTEGRDASSHFTERLALLPGPAHAFNYWVDKQEAGGTWTRAALGIPERVPVFVSAANYYKITPEMQEVWARLLASVPEARLLLHPFNPNWSSQYPIQRFCAEFDRVLARYGIAPDRLIVSTTRFNSRSEVRELVSVGDVYLDTYPFGGVNSLVDPLEAGVPVVTWAGETFRSRMGPALLRALGLHQWIAADADRYMALARELTVGGPERDELRARITEAMSRLPIFLDPLAASEGFGALLETAFDAVSTAGAQAFRADRHVFRVPAVPEATVSLAQAEEARQAGRLQEAEQAALAVLAAQPNSAEARQVLGRVLLGQGRAARAAEYLLAAVQHDERNSALWRDLATAYWKSGRSQEAVQALRGCLQLDGGALDTLLLLGEIALELGDQESVTELIANARAVGGDDPRVQRLVERAGARTAKASAHPHVLVYTDDPQHGGVAQYNHSLLMALGRHGYRVTCVQPVGSSPLLREQQAAGISHRWISYDPAAEFGRSMEDASDAVRAFAADRPDLVIFSDCCPLSNLAARGEALRQGIPYITVVGFVAPYLAERFADQLPRLAAQHAAGRDLVAVSQENLALLRAHFGTRADQGRVIHYGRPERFFAPRNEAARTRLRSELDLPSNAVLCFTAARLTAMKGFDLQLAAATRIAADSRLARVYFAWAGEGDQRAALAESLRQRGLDRRVILLGQRWDVEAWYDAADIFVLPSRAEGMPLAIMEAMAKALPVVATSVSGIPEEMGDTGVLLPDPNLVPEPVVDGLVEAIQRWAQDEPLRLRDGIRGRERATQLFREQDMIERTLRVIADAAVVAP